MVQVGAWLSAGSIRTALSAGAVVAACVPPAPLWTGDGGEGGDSGAGNPGGESGTEAGGTAGTIGGTSGRDGAGRNGDEAGAGGDAGNDSSGGGGMDGGSSGSSGNGGGAEGGSGAMAGRAGGGAGTGGTIGKAGAGGAGAGGMSAGAAGAGTGGTSAGAGAAGMGGAAGSSAGGGGSSGMCATGPVSPWNEEFSSTSLDPAWTVWQYTGQRNNGLTSSANHFSLTTSPGALRYFVDPLTFAAPWINYEPWFHNPYRWYDPGLELARPINGTEWSLDVKVSWYVPLVVNAAGFYVAVHLGVPGTTGFSVAVRRYSNDDFSGGAQSDNNFIWAYAMEPSEPGVSRFDQEPDVAIQAELAPTITRFIRFRRRNADLTVFLSTDGVVWPPTFSTTIPEDFRCAAQRVLLSGEAWAVPNGSYADYDYIRLENAETKRAFITESSRAPDFGGISGADAACNADADAAKISGTYRAWIGDDTGSAPARIARAADGYFRTDGTRIADDYDDLVDGTLDAPLNVTARGTALSLAQAWTNVHLGSAGFPGPASCSNWTTASSNVYGWTGIADRTTSEWTESQILPCGPNRRAHFYCFEQ
jgi:hypothetical protein